MAANDVTVDAGEAVVGLDVTVADTGDFIDVWIGFGQYGLDVAVAEEDAVVGDDLDGGEDLLL